MLSSWDHYGHSVIDAHSTLCHQCFSYCDLMKQPYTYDIQGNLQKLKKLSRATYGLMQSQKAWFKIFICIVILYFEVFLMGSFGLH